MRKSVNRFTVLILSICLIVPGSALAQVEIVFSDVNEEAAFYVAVKYLKENNLVKGYEDGTYKPYQSVNRAEALAMILKAFNRVPANNEDLADRKISPTTPLIIKLPSGTDLKLIDPVSGAETSLQNIQTLEIKAEEGSSVLTLNKAQSGEKPFIDVAETSWYYDTVVLGKKLGIVNGEENGTKFNPNAPVNLAQALRMMYQSSGTDTSTVDLEKTSPPPGVSVESWYARDMAYSAWNGILMQREDGSTFPADKNLNRGELALLLYRLIETKNNKVFGYASWYGDGLSVIRPKNNIEYVDNHLTTAHKTLPMGSLIRVTNMWNGKYVDVAVNDRGPFVIGRVVDLSKSAFNTIGDASDGIMAIQMEVIMIPSE